jgi:hypothetical protein
MHFILVPKYISNHSQIYRILNSLQEVWDQSVEEVMSACFFSVILHQVNKVKYVILPWLKIDHDGSRVFIASLVSVVGGGIISAKHRYNHTGVAVCVSNVHASDE